MDTLRRRSLGWKNNTNKYHSASTITNYNNNDDDDDADDDDEYRSPTQRTLGYSSYSNGGCSLCADRAIPPNLNTHVTEEQTCADVHLQLSMLRSDIAMCATGQTHYRDLCCTTQQSSSSSDITTAVGWMVGAAVTGCLLKKMVVTRQHRHRRQTISSNGVGNRNRYRKDCHNDDDDNNFPGAVSFNNHSHCSRGGESRCGGSRSHGIELSSSSYHRMEDQPTTTMTSSTKFPSEQHPRRQQQQEEESSSMNNISKQSIVSVRRSLSKSRSRDMMMMSPQPYYHSNHNDRTIQRDRSCSRSRSRPVSRSRPRRDDSKDDRHYVSRTTRPNHRNRERRSNSPTRNRRIMQQQQQQQRRHLSRTRGSRSQSCSKVREGGDGGGSVRPHSYEAADTSSRQQMMKQHRLGNHAHCPRERSPSRGSRSLPRGVVRAKSVGRMRPHYYEVEMGTRSDDAFLVVPTQVL